MASIGRVLLIPKGDYSGSTTYNQLDWVRYNGKAWVCKVDGTVNVTPAQGANWQLLAQDGSGGGGGASDWDDINYKPFETLETTTDFSVDGNDQLQIKRGTYGTVRVVSGGTTTDLEASGDSIFEIDAGTNVTITANDSSNPKKITINSSGGGGGGSYTAGNGIDSTELANDKIQLDYGNVEQSNTTKPVTGKSVYDAIPTVNDATLTIQKNGTTVNTFTANASSNSTANIVTGEYIKTASVSSGSVTFTGVDDSVNSGGCGYDVFFDITSSSTNKSPYAKLTSISGEGTSNCTLTYQTDADDGTNTAHLYQYK